MTLTPDDIRQARAIALDRAKDEMHLQWLQLRDSGVSSYAIGKRFGVRHENVRTVTLRIMADLDKSEAQG